MFLNENPPQGSEQSKAPLKRLHVDTQSPLLQDSSEQVLSSTKSPIQTHVTQDLDRSPDSGLVVARSDARRMASPTRPFLAIAIPSSPSDETRHPMTICNYLVQGIEFGVLENKERASLSRKVKFYLGYHRDHLSHRHYAFKSDSSDFLKKTFLQIAINTRPLMYAVVAFSAYHFALSGSDRTLDHFFPAYNMSIESLRSSLAEGHKHVLSNLLTILQLATIGVRQQQCQGRNYDQQLTDL